MPQYLLQASFDKADAECGQVIFRASGHSEEESVTREISLETFREILVQTFHFSLVIVDEQIQRMRHGSGFVVPFSISEDDLHRAGLI